MTEKKVKCKCGELKSMKSKQCMKCYRSGTKSVYSSYSIRRALKKK